MTGSKQGIVSQLLQLSDCEGRWQLGEVTVRHGHRELSADPVKAAVNGLRHAAHRLGPVEGFLHPFPFLLG